VVTKKPINPSNPCSIYNIFTYNLFDKHGELDLTVAGKSLAVGGVLGVWGDMIIKFADNSDSPLGGCKSTPKTLCVNATGDDKY
jgi:hypothetical protein